MKEVSTSFLKKGSYDEYIKMLNNSKTDYIHFDVMDGIFVDNTNLNNNDLIKYIDMSNKKNDVHLMVNNPTSYIDSLIGHKVEYITIHKEIDNYLEMINKIKTNGIKAGLAINPETKIEDITHILKDISLVLVMGVHPGRSGQKYIEETTNKINKLYDIKKENNYNYKISVDGGVNEKVINNLKNTDIIVSASYILDDLNNIDILHNI